MTQYFKQPGAITIAPDFSGIALDSVPAGYYRITVSQELGFYLTEVDPLQVAEKIYGNLLEHLPRIEAAFNEITDKPMSVMLEGLKGSGKSLLMKTLAKRFVENEGGIVLMCNSPFTGDAYFEFLQKISQKKIVLMDEFDKVYVEKDARNNILTLLDGNFASHTMFILTMNAGLASGNFEFFHNRPGRVMFNIKFRGVPLDAIQAYAEDHLTNKDKVADVVTFVKRFTDFNMDMLGKLINEINYCPHLSLEQISVYLNVKPDLSLDDVFFNARIFREGIDVTKHIHGSNSDRCFKSFLKTLANPSNGATNLNFTLTDTIVWIPELDREYNPVTDKGTNVETVNGAVIHAGRGKKVFVERFDEYLYTTDTVRVQDPKTGVITLTCKSDDSNSWVIELTPEVMKRYNYAF